MDTEDIIHKYTGQPVSWNDLRATHTHPLGAHLANAVQRAADAVATCDTRLAQTAGFISATAETVRRATAATPGESVPALNSLGELQSAGPRLDALVAARHDRITHLRVVTDLWHKFVGLLDPDDLGPDLTTAGFTPIPTAPTDTRTTYAHRSGGREVTVALDPHHETGVEVTVRYRDTVAWTIMAGRDVPDSVVAAIAYTALIAPPTATDQA